MKKRPAVILLFAFLTVIVFGCSGGGVDENKPLSEIKAEAQDMSVKNLQNIIEKYKSAMAEKKKEIDALSEKIKEIPLKEMLGEEAKLLRKESGELKDSLKALKDRMNLYIAELKKQGGTF